MKKTVHKKTDQWVLVMPPKNKRVLYVSPDDILSGIIYWGIKQSPFDFPDNISKLLPKLAGILRLKFITMGIKEIGKIRLWKITYEDLHTYLIDLVYKIKELQDWNISKIDRNNGIKFDDNRSFFMGKNRGDPTPPEYDFIDIDALARNVANDIYKDNIFVHDDVTSKKHSLKSKLDLK